MYYLSGFGNFARVPFGVPLKPFFLGACRLAARVFLEDLCTERRVGLAHWIMCVRGEALGLVCVLLRQDSTEARVMNLCQVLVT